VHAFVMQAIRLISLAYPDATKFLLISQLGFILMSLFIYVPEI